MKTTGRPRGSGARFVRLVFPQGRSASLYIGRALWYEVGAPRRVRVRRNRSQSPTLLYLLPVDAGGYRVSQAPAPGLGMPKLSMGRGIALELGLIPGRFAARVEGGCIVADLAMEVTRWT